MKIKSLCACAVALRLLPTAPPGAHARAQSMTVDVVVVNADRMNIVEMKKR